MRHEPRPTFITKDPQTKSDILTELMHFLPNQVQMISATVEAILDAGDDAEDANWSIIERVTSMLVILRDLTQAYVLYAEEHYSDSVDRKAEFAEKPAPNSITPREAIDIFHRIEGLRKDLKGDPEAIRAGSEYMRKNGVSEAFIETLESVLLDAGGEP